MDMLIKIKTEYLCKKNDDTCFNDFQICQRNYHTLLWHTLETEIRSGNSGPNLTTTE